MDLTLAAVILAALFFDFTNGFHDAANAIATSVATKALTPLKATLLAGAANFAGAFISLKVASTIASGIVKPGSITLTVILAGVIGAIFWNLLSWRIGLPTSSSHALIGGVGGAAISAAGLGVIQWKAIWSKVGLPSLLSPVLGLVIAAVLVGVILLFIRRRNRDKVNSVFRRLQVVSAGVVALTHGTNDAQKTMGVIALALLVEHPGSKFSVPLWVVVSAASAMALGTYVGGWRIIRTLGKRLTHIEPFQGFAAETATAGILWATASVGFPVSTTHTVTGSVLGAGAALDHKKVHWKLAGGIAVAWLITIPGAAAVAMLMERLTRLHGGVAIAMGVVVVLAAFAMLHRSHSAEVLDLDLDLDMPPRPALKPAA